MTPDKHAFDDSMRLSDEAAHRLLARAVELDARYAHEVPLTQLREIAAEAGIDARAFDRAFAELQGASLLGTADAGGPAPRSSGLLARLWHRVRTGEVLPKSPPVWDGVVRNVVAFAAAWALLSLASRLGYAIDADWPIRHAIEIAFNVCGVGLALRLRGRVAALVLAVTAAAQAAEYPMHLIFGIETVQGGATKLALILAGLLGIGFGALLTRKRPSSPPADAPPMDAASAMADRSSSHEPDDARDPRRLLLRLA